MIFDPSTEDHLKPWLTKTLEPICDADPEALADYILALLKHNAPESELRKELTSQLEEFLEKEGPPFLDTLFTVLRTKSYLPYGTSSPPPVAPSHPASHSNPSQPQPIETLDTGIPIPFDALIGLQNAISGDRGRKRGPDFDDRDGRPPKGPRLSGDGWRGGGWDGRGRGDVMDGGMGGGRGYRPPDQKRGICRDYHNHGYCSRGAYCKYSHGEDAFVPGQMLPMNGQQMQNGMFMPMFPPNGGMPFGGMNGAAGGSNNAPYDPHEARMDMRPAPGPAMGQRPQRTPILPRENGAGPRTRSGELPVIQDLTPQEAADAEASRAPAPGDGGPAAPHADRMGNGMGPSAPGYGMPGAHPIPAPMDVEMAGPGPMGPPRGYRPMRGRGGARPSPGFFGGDVQRFRPERRQDKTLVVEKIPEDKLSLEAVNGWFKQFGTVTNVAVDAGSAKALVSFETHDAAHAAWKSEEAVFANRFVKVFWHRPMEGHGQVGQKALAASAPLVASRNSRPAAGEQQPTPAPATPAPAHTRKPSTPAASAAKSALAAKQQLLEQQIAEQKSLMEKLGSASAEEKKEILARLRKLGEEMKPSAAPTPTPPPASEVAVGKRRASSAPGADDHEQKERDRLDKELEMHAANHEGEEESTEALKAKLARLKAEAASLGIDASAETPYSPSYRGFRGRGRGGRSYYRGAMRGGPPRASMKLDNRPKKLLVKDVAADVVQAVRDWYETTGQVESVDAQENGDLVVAFRTRAAAEQGLAKGPNIPMAGHKQISWYTTQATPAKASPTNANGPQPSREEQQDVHMPGPAAEPTHDAHTREEEMVVSGWGADEEDGFGML